MYKENLSELREKLLNMSIEEIAADLETYIGDLEIKISIVDKEDSGIFFKNEQ